MLKGILLDLDNTLYDYEPLHQLAKQQVIQYCVIEFSISEEVANAKLIEAKSWVKRNVPETAASHNRLLYMQRMCELISVSALKHAPRMEHLYWQTFLHKMRLSPSALLFLQRYKSLSICLVTDLTADIQYQKTKKLGLESWVDFIVTSEEAGCEKPHPYIFQLALDKLKLRKDQVCMVGDNFSKDIVGAEALGIKSYWLNNNKDNSLDGFLERPLIKVVSSLDAIDW